jgi:Secretion system C-terminal sorting domain
VQGDACNDNNVCTINDVITAGCVCAGTFQDTDLDGLCDANDNCPTLAGVQGDACNDNNVCTINDVITAGCVCAGTFQDTDLDGICDANDNCPTVAGTVGSPCNDSNPFTGGDVLNGSCQCVGTPVTCDNWTLTVNADNAGSEISWQIVDATSPFVLASGGPYVNGSTNTATVCVPQGACFNLVFTDAGNNGIAGGGWVLTDNNGRRIVDNAGNGACFSTSSTTPEAFCNQPSSVQTVIASHCDKENWLATGVIIASADPAVSAQWAIGDQTDDGYQFWFTNPCGGYTRKIFRNHATSGGQGPANAIRATKLYLGSIVTNPLPQGNLLNVRVRSKVNGVYGNWGPACRFRIDPTSCTLTKLNDIVGDPNLSCGVVGKMVGASGQPGKIFAKVVYQGATPANRYKFEFAVPGEGYLRNIVSNSAGLLLGVWSTNPLLCGAYTYDVRVAASFDGGLTYCPFGDICTVGITNNQAQPYCTPVIIDVNGGGDRAMVAKDNSFRMWPNPNDGSKLNVTMAGLSEELTTAQVDVFDLFGKRIISRTVVVGEGSFATTLPLENELTSGLYLVTITAGSEVRTERLIVQ